MLTHFCVEVEEIGISLFTTGSEKQRKQYSSTPKVWVLLGAGIGIWECISELCLVYRAWPKNFLESALWWLIHFAMCSDFLGIRADLAVQAPT